MGLPKTGIGGARESIDNSVEAARQLTESLLSVTSFAIGSTFANLVGAQVLSRDDAVDRLHLLADSLETVDVVRPEVASAMAERLHAMADAISKDMLH